MAVPEGIKPATPAHARHVQGFSLVELMITMAIAAIFMALAAPSFDSITLRSKLRSYSNAFASSAVNARSEAIKRNAPVTLCVSSDGVSCIAGSWQLGWIIFADTDNSGAVDGAEVLLYRQEPIDNRFRMTEIAALDRLFFQPSGVGIKDTGGNLVSVSINVCRGAPGPVGNEERVIALTATGRSTITKTTAGVCP